MLDRMVLGTGWIILRWLDKMMCSGGEEDKSDKEKMMDRLKIITTNNKSERIVNVGHFQCEECDVSKIQKETSWG